MNHSFSFSNLLKIVSVIKMTTKAQSGKPIKSFAFLDLETTGLPSEEHNKTKITELSISIVDSNHLKLGTFPRVCNKLNLCLNPCKTVSPISTEITGLSNDLLEHQSSFSLDVVNTISDFLNLHNKPICFVAHNGNQFDYPILRAEIDKLEGEFLKDIVCVDSLLCFKDLHRRQELSSSLNAAIPSVITSEEVDSSVCEKAKSKTELPIEFSDGFDEFLCDAMDEYEESIKKINIQRKNETTPIKQIKFRKRSEIDSATRDISPYTTRQRVSFKLGDIYERLTSKAPVDSHHAEADVQCLIHCAAKYGDDFIAWANENAKLFNDIPPMKPGRRLGF